MAIHLQSMEISHFRGINQLFIDQFNHVNIFAGDNNSGKTTVLEAMLLLQNMSSFTNILRVARLRESLSFSRSVSAYESFLNLFPRNGESLEISVKAKYHGKDIFTQLVGETKMIMLDPQTMMSRVNNSNRNRLLADLNSGIHEMSAFYGELRYGMNHFRDQMKIEFDQYSSTFGREIKKNSDINMVYLSPTDHLRGSIFSRIIKNDAYKRICIRALQLFDPQISDLLILENDQGLAPVEYLQHEVLGNMPISTYGDGIKKVIAIADAIARASGGVLLIDEVETAIHAKYYDDIFRFMIKASLEFEVQVFVTTHSIEAIDGFLATQDYEHQNNQDAINVITFKKENANAKTLSRVLPGRRVFMNRDQFGFEVRL